MSLISTAILEKANQKIESSPTVKANWDSLSQRIISWQRSFSGIPEEGGGWIHNYICPDHWLPLKYDGERPTEHECAAGHLCSGEKYDAAWRVWRHREMSEVAREAALSFAVTDVKEGRETAVSILFQYANFYAQLDGEADAEPWMIQGHAFNQALTEALWVVPLIQAYDLISDTLSPQENELLIRDLWRPLTAVMIQAQDKLIAKNHSESNYLAWINTTIGCLGFVLNDQTLIQRAIYGEGGFQNHLDKAIKADGLEYEGTPYYHNFVLLAYLILAEAANANGINLYQVEGSQGQSIKSMGYAFAQLMWPDGTPIDLADGSYWADSIYDSEICQAFEILNAVEPNQLFQAVLSATYARQGVSLTNWAALLYGNDHSKAAEQLPSQHAMLHESGIVVLRTKNKLAASLVFSPHCDSHYHHDRLSLLVWPFSKDAGCPLYGIPARRAWYSHSYAHNTVVVDGKSHTPCGGDLVSWNGRCVRATATNAYEGVHLERTVSIENEMIRDEFVMQSDQSHTFEWIFHLDGEYERLSDVEQHAQPLREQGAGSFIDLHSKIDIQQSIAININFSKEAYQLTLQGETPFTLLLGTCPGPSRAPQQKRHVLIAQSVGQSQRYWTKLSQN